MRFAVALAKIVIDDDTHGNPPVATESAPRSQCGQPPLPSRINAITVFVGVLAWGWLWGLGGLLLGVPILMAVKAVCDRIDKFKPIGELLGS